MPCNITTPAILSVQTGLASSGARHAAARGIPHEKETKLQSFPRLEQGPEYHSLRNLIGRAENKCEKCRRGRHPNGFPSSIGIKAKT
ncbi:hypothetical protein FOVSG1_004762 [Fusarium oxysporum f. sp. vasinfectum]